MSRPRRIADRELLAAARRIFLRKGVHAPVSDVAKELGVTVGALFFRMKSKERLLSQALLPPFPPREIQALARQIPSDTLARHELVALLSGLCDFLPEALPGFFLLHTAGVLPMQNADCPESMDVVMRNALATWLRRAKARSLVWVASPSATADAVMGALEARFLHAYLLKRTFTPAQNRSFVIKLLKATLGSSPGSGRP